MAILTRRPWDAWQRILEFLNTQILGRLARTFEQFATDHAAAFS